MLFENGDWTRPRFGCLGLITLTIAVGLIIIGVLIGTLVD